MNEFAAGKETDSRPYVICHMLASLDGKIDGAFFAAPESGPAIAEYGNIRNAYGCKSVVYGTITMMGGCKRRQKACVLEDMAVRV